MFELIGNGGQKMLNRVSILKKRYEQLYEIASLHTPEFNKIEQELGIILPNDFKEITQFYDGGITGNLLGGIYFPGFLYNKKCPLVENTSHMRDLGLPPRYIFLYEDDAGAIFMETQDSPDKPARVIWCDIPDAENLLAGKPFEYNPTIFPSFTDFFESLVEQEEKDRAEDAAFSY